MEAGALPNGHELGSPIENNAGCKKETLWGHLPTGERKVLKERERMRDKIRVKRLKR